MTSFRKFIYRLGLHHFFMKPVEKLMAGLQYIRFCKWISANKQLEINDFPTDNDYLKRYTVHEYIAGRIVKGEAVNYLEFGTADCETFLWWLEKNTHVHSRFFGFDTFTGLPEDWGIYKKGAFDLNGNIPDIADERARLYKGLFQETLQGFLEDFENDKRNIILLDADLYSSTLFVMTTIAPFLKKGDIIIFDEFSSQQHEFRAYEDFLKAFPHIRLECFAASNNYSCVAFHIYPEHKNR